MDDIEPGRIYYMSYIHDLINENRVDQGLMEISPWSTRKRIREYDKANPGHFMPKGGGYSRSFRIKGEDLIKILPDLL